MSLSLSFTDASGNANASAVWRAVQINIGAVDEVINLTFYAYKDIDAFNSGMQPLPGGIKNYVITGDEFATIASSVPTGTTLYDVLANASENYALNKLDTDSGKTDDNGNKILVSFFQNATQM